MYEYRQIILQMRFGYTGRKIARAGLAGRKNVKIFAQQLNFKVGLTDSESQMTFNKKSKAMQSNTPLTLSAKVYFKQTPEWW